MKGKNIYFLGAKLAGLKRSVARAWLLLLAIVALKAGMAQSVTVTTFADLKTHLEAGHDVTLGANIVAGTGTITIPASKTATLRLNGHDLSYPDSSINDECIRVSDGATFNLYGDGTIRYTGTSYRYNPVIVVWGATAVFNMYGGTICNFLSSSSQGSAVFVTNGACFNMSGGVISGNKSSARYGSILVYSSSTYSSTLNMTGGTIEYNEANGSSAGGGGICVTKYSKVRLTDVTIRYNKATQGGAGVYIEDNVSDVSGGDLLISDCAFSENKVTGSGMAVSGGGLYLRIEATLSNCTFNGNESVLGGGIEFYPLSTSGVLHVEDCVFSSNKATSDMGDGGGIHISAGELQMLGTSIKANQARRGGGVYMKESTTATIGEGNEIEENSATYGGGFYLEDNSIVTVRDNAIVFDCEATEGGGFYLSSGSELETDGKTSNTMSITGCQAQTLGGGIFIGNGATANISDAQVNDNEAQSGGGIYIYPGGTANLYGCMFEGNEAVRGGGIYNYGILNGSEVRYIGNTASGFGGGLYNCVATYTSDTDLFGNNSAPSGGGIYSERSDMSATKLTLSANSASYYGGGMYQTGGNITMESECLITGNTAGFNGGGVYLNGGNLTFEEGTSGYWQTISENIANECGGGFYVAGGTLRLNGYSMVSSNCATTSDGGGAFVTGGSSSALFLENDYNNFNSNTAGRDGGAICLKGSGTSCNVISTEWGATYIEYNAAGRDGGGIWVDNDSWFSVLAGYFYLKHNMADVEGGGICNRDGVVNLGGVAAYFTGNSCGDGKYSSAMYQGGDCWIAGSISAEYDVDPQICYLAANRYFTKKSTLRADRHYIGVYVEDAFHTRDILLSYDGATDSQGGLVEPADRERFRFYNNYGHLGAVYDEDHQDQDYENYTPGDVIELFHTWVDVVNEKPDSFVVTMVDGEEHVDITCPEDLAWLISYVNGFNGVVIGHPSVNVSIKSDLDMSAWVWESIGMDFGIKNLFGLTIASSGYLGSIDGEGHLITGLHNRQDIGTPGFVDLLGASDGPAYGLKRPQIRHLFIVDCDFVCSCPIYFDWIIPLRKVAVVSTPCWQSVGIIANRMSDGSIVECEAAGSISTVSACLENGGGYAGGICGEVRPCKINSTAGATYGSPEIVSCMAMPDIETAGTAGGLVGVMKGGRLLNSFSNMRLDYVGDADSWNSIGCLAGFLTTSINEEGCAPVVENCYSRLHGFSLSDPDLNKMLGTLIGRGDNDNFVRFSYTASDLAALYDYIGWNLNSGSTPAPHEGQTVGHGTYSPTQTPYLYQHDDNNVTLAPASGSNPYYSSDESSLLHTLNAYAADKGYTSWMRTTAGTGNGGNINDDYPVLEIERFNSIASNDGRVLQYGDFGELLERYNDTLNGGSLCLYAAADMTDRPGLVNDSEVTLYINEDAPLNHNSTGMTAYVGITLDNSAGALGANPNGLTANGITDAIDWHMFSTPLTNAPLGVNYQGNSTQYNYWTGDVLPEFGFYPETSQNGYFPSKTYGTNGLNGTAYYHDWDYYCFYEPDYHWINFKRNTPSHWHEDEPHNWIDYTNETSLAQGKGYLLAIKEDCFLQSYGTLSNGQVNITATRQGAHCTGYNLLGNPYPCYLDFKAFAEANSGPGKIWNDVSTASYILLDEDKQGYVTYTYDMSSNPMSASRYINMHQGFFIVAENQASAVFDNSMRSVRSYGEGFRGEDEEPAYPLVNLIVTEGNGNKTYTVVELDRPEKGGSLWASDLRVGNAKMCAHYDDECYSVVFAQPGVTSMPIWFESNSDAQYTISWNTQNGTFGYLHLIDNITGADIDCLADSCYVFQASANDYKSRFKLKFEYTGIDEEQQEYVTDFAFMKDGQLVVTGSGHLELMDLNGRVLYASELVSAQSMLALPSVASGLYLLRLANAYGCMTQKIIIK